MLLNKIESICVRSFSFISAQLSFTISTKTSLIHLHFVYFILFYFLGRTRNSSIERVCFAERVIRPSRAHIYLYQVNGPTFIWVLSLLFLFIYLFSFYFPSSIIFSTDFFFFCYPLHCTVLERCSFVWLSLFERPF